jgi:uncharacterized membrane protein
MPYCCQCGNQTGGADQYCGICGARQPLVSSGAEGMNPHTASILCYIPVLGWIPAIIVLASQRYRNDTTVRFHAFQGIYLFVAWLIVDWVLSPMGGWSLGHGMRGGWIPPGLMIGPLLKVLVFFTWIFMLVKTSQGTLFKLPLLGELADRSVAEQK